MTGNSPSSTHPLHPPTSEDDRVAWLRLLRSRRVGPATFYRLIAEHGSAQAGLAALPGVAAAAGVTDYSPCPVPVVQAEMRAASAAGAKMICRGEPSYPKTLATIPDPPPVLWAVGDLSLLNRPMVALVGARNASSLGTRMARAMAKGLGEAQHVIVSGLARGVDTAAHLASLDTGTIAVMAGGVDVLYPAENMILGENIGKQGLRLSEQPMGMQPFARHFPTRNRIISGLSQAVVVIEAAARSGSLITARNALDQGRDVLAVPGHPFDARASGCNMLIRDGARLVRNPEDVIEAIAAPVLRIAQPEMDLDTQKAPDSDTRSLQDTAQLHQEILSRLGPSPLAEDQLVRDLKAPAKLVAPALVDLELEGRVTRQPGGLLALAN